MAARKKSSTRDQRRIRTQQIILGIIGVLVILSMVIGLLTQY